MGKGAFFQKSLNFIFLHVSEISAPKKWSLKIPIQKKYMFFSHFLHIHNFALKFYFALSIDTGMNQ